MEFYKEMNLKFDEQAVKSKYIVNNFREKDFTVCHWHVLFHSQMIVLLFKQMKTFKNITAKL